MDETDAAAALQQLSETKIRQITATSGANKKKPQKKMKEMIHTSAVTIARTRINISSL